MLAFVELLLVGDPEGAGAELAALLHEPAALPLPQAASALAGAEARADIALLAAGDDIGAAAAWVEALRAAGCAVPIVAVYRGIRAEGARLLRAGADAAVQAGADARHIRAQIQAVLRRAAARRPEGPWGLSLDPAQKLATAAGEDLGLTGREFAILELLARRPGRVVTRELILDCLYDGRDGPGRGTIDVFIHALKRKLARRLPALRIETERGVGYRLQGPS